MTSVVQKLVAAVSQNRGKIAAGAVAAAVVSYLVRQRALKRSKQRKAQRAVKSALSTAGGEGASGRKRAPEINAEFFRRLGKLMDIMVPGYRTKEMMLLCVQAAFLFGRTIASVYVARLDGMLVKALVTADLPKFLWGLVLWMAISVPSTYINSMIKFLQSRIGICFRTRLVKHVHDRYLANNTFYAVGNLDGRLGNCDQRITQDVSKFCESLSALYSNLAKPVLDVALFGTQLAFAVGSAGPLIMTGFYVVTGGLLRFVTPAFGKMAAEEARLEGNFRFAHARLITNAEEIAFYRGGQREKGILNEYYAELVSHVNKIFRKRILHGMLESITIKYAASAVGLLICGIPVFWADSLGSFGGQHGSGDDFSSRTEDYIRNRRYLLNLADAIGRILYAYKEVSELAGLMDRVYTMLQVFDDVDKGVYVKTISTTNAELLETFTGGKLVETERNIKFEDVPVVTPNGDVLLKNLSLEIKPGWHVVVVGPNGCGKSSLFRILGGLWPVKHGVVHKPTSVVYVPQRPYLVVGTLRDQVIYPDTVEDMKARGKTDEDILELLKLCHLGYVPETYPGGLDAIKEWKDVLSGGEKQRMGLARIFYAKPAVAVLDECTSQISLDVEGILYGHAADLGISLLSISHRPSIWQYHSHVLQMDGHGNFEFKPLDSTHRMSLEEEKAGLHKKLRDVPAQRERFKELCEILGHPYDDPSHIDLDDEEPPEEDRE